MYQVAKLLYIGDRNSSQSIADRTGTVDTAILHLVGYSRVPARLLLQDGIGHLQWCS